MTQKQKDDLYNYGGFAIIMGGVLLLVGIMAKSMPDFSKRGGL